MNTPCFWETLKLDGVVNQGNWRSKKWWSEKLKNLQRGSDLIDHEGSRRKSGRSGLKKLVITAADGGNLHEWFDFIAEVEIASDLEELVVSFVDYESLGYDPVDNPGDDPVEDLVDDSVDNSVYERARSGKLLVTFLSKTCGKTLKSLTWCPISNIKTYNWLPSSDLYPCLQHITVYGPLDEELDEISLFGLLSRPSFRDDLPSPLVSLRLFSTSLVSDPDYDNDFNAPQLEHVELSAQRRIRSTWVDSLTGLGGLKILQLSCLDALLSSTNSSPLNAAVWDPQKLQRLEDLNINHCSENSRRGGSQLLRFLVHSSIPLAGLTRLTLINVCLSLTMDELKYLNFSSLFHLTWIENTTSSNPDNLPNLSYLPSFPQLVELKSNQTEHKDYTMELFMESLPERAPKLRKLNLDYNRNLTASIIDEYLESLERIRSPIMDSHCEGCEVAKMTYQSPLPVLDELSLIGTGIWHERQKGMERYVKPGGLKGDNDVKCHMEMHGSDSLHLL